MIFLINVLVLLSLVFVCVSVGASAIWIAANFDLWVSEEQKLNKQCREQHEPHN